MHSTIELARLAAQDRERDATRDALKSVAKRLAACCQPSSIWSRLSAAIQRAGDVCCPSDQERLARTVRAVNGC